MLLATPSGAFARGEINITPPTTDGPVVIVGRGDDTQPDPPDNNEPYDEGDEFDQLPGHRDETVDTTFECGIGDLGGGWIDIFNVSAKQSPSAIMHIVLPDGSILDVPLPYMAPGGNWAVELPYDIPADWDCQYTMTILSYPAQA